MVASVCTRARLRGFSGVSQKVQIDFLSQNKLQIKMQIDLPTCRPTAERIGNFADHFALHMILIPLHTLVLFYS